MKAALNKLADKVSSDEFADQVDNQSRILALVAIAAALVVILVPAFIYLYERGLLWSR